MCCKVFFIHNVFFFLVRSPRTAPRVIGPLGTAAKDVKDRFDSFDPSAVCIIVLRHIVSLLSTPHSSSGASFPFDSFLILCVIEGGEIPLTHHAFASRIVINLGPRSLPTISRGTAASAYPAYYKLAGGHICARLSESRI